MFVTTPAAKIHVNEVTFCALTRGHGAVQKQDEQTFHSPVVHLVPVIDGFCFLEKQVTSSFYLILA